jgi:hypothetical protein
VSDAGKAPTPLELVESIRESRAEAQALEQELVAQTGFSYDEIVSRVDMIFSQRPPVRRGGTVQTATHPSEEANN